MRKRIQNLNILFTDEQMNDYISSNADSDIKDAYWRMNHVVAKADIWRYTILFNNGGSLLSI